ncbi:hypothetical protein [Pseudonocardia sp. 73-21]|uniref:hypothetical protein n=1 Tax=Pseudonocardia sp. 73-21 TaxID=1895809 RepID=UPI00095F22BC|nr:hypothetical protein [Pseudonocardia sp. 73-21]OJY39312.1 MAG: hypothetical protein BGP03_23420 [Pseudonocardia sp. 73-21]
MDVKWWVGVLPSGVENVQTVASGHEATHAAAAGAAVDALVVVAADRGRQEYRLRVAGAELMVLPGLTEEGDVDLDALAGTWHHMWHET